LKSQKISLTSCLVILILLFTTQIDNIYINLQKLSGVNKFITFYINHENENFSYIENSKGISSHFLEDVAKNLETLNENLISGHIFYLLHDYESSMRNYLTQLKSYPHNQVAKFFAYRTNFLIYGEKFSSEGINLEKLSINETLAYLNFFKTDNPYQFSMPLLKNVINDFYDNEKLWKIWLLAGLTHENQSQHNLALQIYHEGLEYQDKYRVNFYQGSFWYHVIRINYIEKNEKLIELLNIYDRYWDSKDFLTINDESYFHLYKGRILSRVDEAYYSEEIIQEYLYALSLLPEDSAILSSLGYHYLSHYRDLRLAKNYFERLIKKNSNNPEGYYFLGEIYRIENDLKNAKIYYEIAFSKDPNYLDVKKRLETIESNLVE